MGFEIIERLREGSLDAQILSGEESATSLQKLFGQIQTLASPLLEEQSSESILEDMDVLERKLSLLERTICSLTRRNPLDIFVSVGLDGGTQRLALGDPIRIKVMSSYEEAKDNELVNRAIGLTFPDDVVVWKAVGRYLLAQDYAGADFDRAPLTILEKSMKRSIRKVSLSDDIMDLIGRDKYVPRNIFGKSLEIIGPNGVLRDSDSIENHFRLMPELYRLCTQPFFDCHPNNKKYKHMGVPKGDLEIKEFDWHGAARFLFFRNYDVIQNAWYSACSVMEDLSLSHGQSKINADGITDSEITDADWPEVLFISGDRLEVYQVGMIVLDEIIKRGIYFLENDVEGVTVDYNHLAAGLYWHGMRMINRDTRLTHSGRVARNKVRMLASINFPRPQKDHYVTDLEDKVDMFEDHTRKICGKLLAA